MLPAPAQSAVKPGSYVTHRGPAFSEMSEPRVLARAGSAEELTECATGRLNFRDPFHRYLRFSEQSGHHWPPHMNGRPNSAASVACV
jgi:hypothetical protein